MENKVNRHHFFKTKLLRVSSGLGHSNTLIKRVILNISNRKETPDINLSLRSVGKREGVRDKNVIFVIHFLFLGHILDR